MKSYFTTLGFNEGPIIRFLTSTQARREDSLVIVIPSPIAEGTRSALESLRAQSLRSGFPEPKVQEVDLSKDFFGVLSDVIKIVSTLDEPIYTDLSLGMRLMNVFIIVSLIVSGKKFKAFVRDEAGGSKEFSFESSEINALLKEYSEEEVKLLRDVAEGDKTVKELADRLKKSEKTIQNRVSELKKSGILVQKGKNSVVQLTPLGKCLVEVLQIRKEEG